MLGEIIYDWVIYLVDEQLAGKITGMILDLENSRKEDFNMTLQNFETFRLKVLEAQQLIINNQNSTSSDANSSIKAVGEHGASAGGNSSSSFLGNHSNE